MNCTLHIRETPSVLKMVLQILEMLVLHGCIYKGNKKITCKKYTIEVQLIK